jgi:hypothetical protein
MGVFKLGLTSALIYGLFNVLLFAGLMVLGRFTIIGIMLNPIRLGFILFTVWLISYCLHGGCSACEIMRPRLRGSPALRLESFVRYLLERTSAQDR